MEFRKTVTSFLLAGLILVQAQQTALPFFKPLQKTDAATSDFTANKTGSRPIIHPGEDISYQITFQNVGPTGQQNISLTDPIPAGLSFDPQGSTPGCQAPGSAVVCPPQTYNPGESQTVTLHFQLPSSAQCPATLDNVASINQGQTPILETNHVQTEIVCPAGEFLFSKAGPPTVSPGGIITYGLRVQNIGQTTQMSTGVIDAIPSGLTFISGSSSAGCQVQSVYVACQQESYTPAQIRTYVLAFQVDSSRQCDSIIDNVAQLVQQSILGDDSNHVTTRVICPAPTADLSIIKTGPATVTRGGTVTYSLLVSNAGPATATNVVIKDEFESGPPSNLVFLQSSGANCALDSNGHAVNCALGSVVPGQPVTVNLTFQVPAAVSCVPVTTHDNARVDSGLADPDSSDNYSYFQTVLTCPVINEADVSVVKTGPVNILEGQNMNYIIGVKNNGPVQADNVSIADSFPAGLEFVSVEGAVCIQNANNITCSLGSLAPDQMKTIIAYFRVLSTNACYPRDIQNTVTVETSSPDPYLTNNYSNFVTHVRCPAKAYADLSITKTGPATVIRGQTITYSIIAANLGPDTATGIVITDPVPAGLQFVSVSGADCNQTGNQLVCNVTSLSSGQTTPIISATFLAPQVSYCQQQSVQNTATVASPINDPQLNNNQGSAVTLIDCPQNITADVSVAKTGPETAVRGQTVTYNLVVTNSGPATATGIKVTDYPPSDFVAVETPSNCTPPSVNNGSVTCNVGSLAPGSSVSLPITFGILPVTGGCQTSTVQNTAVVESSTIDPAPGNNSSSMFTQVACPAKTSDLSVVKTGPQSVSGNGQVTYQIAVRNLGPDISTNTMLVDTVPAGLTFVSASGADCSVSGSGAGLNCPLGTIAPGTTVNLSLDFRLASGQSCAPRTIINTAHIVGDNIDPVPANSVSQVSTNITCPVENADLGVTLTGPASAVCGQTLAYIVTANNAGPSAAQNSGVRFPIPANLTYQSATGASCSVYGSEVDCIFGSMNAGQTIPITLNFQTPASALTVQALAMVASSTNDPNPSNNTSQTITTNVTCGQAVNITLFKSDNRTTVNVNETLRYSIVITNNGSAGLTNLTVNDPVPNGVNITSVSDGGTVNGQTVTWNSISVGAVSSRALYIDGTVRSDVPDGTILTNTVYVNNISASDQTTVRSTVNPPYNPPYNPRYTPPYYPPYYYSSSPPPVYYQPTTPVNPVVYYSMPKTGTEGQDYYANPDATLESVKKKPEEDESPYAAVFYATVVTMFAFGSAAASKMIAGMI